MELQGDGIIENLYHYLWSKDSLFNRNPQVNIPDTILYRYEQPAFWYFTSKQKGSNPLESKSPGRSINNSSTAVGQLGSKSVSDLENMHPLETENATKIMRKARKNLTNKEIERVFLKNHSPSGIIAVYMYRRREKNIVNVMKRHEQASMVDNNGEGMPNKPTDSIISHPSAVDGGRQLNTDDDAVEYTEVQSESGKDLISNIHDKRKQLNERETSGGTTVNPSHGSEQDN